MKKVLMVTTAFPPPEDRGRKVRMAVRAKHSFKYGWETVVLTQGDNTHNYVYNADTGKINVFQVSDPLQRSLNFASKKVVGDSDLKQSTFKKLFESIRPLFFLDMGNGWIVPAVITGRQIIEKENIDLMYTINHPFSLHIIGLLLKKCTDIPWLAEFRDPCVGNPLIYKSKLKYLHKIFERKVVESSDTVIFYDGIQVEGSYFYKTYPYLPKSKFRRLPSHARVGYDSERLKDIPPKVFDKFTITYTGSFNGGASSVKNFLAGLKMCTRKCGLSSQDVQVNFVGEWGTEYELIVRRMGLDTIVQKFGWLPYDCCMGFIKGSDLLLLILGSREGDELNIPTKIYDYIIVKKPILALAPSGWKAAKLVESERLGMSVSPDDPQKIANALETHARAHNGARWIVSSIRK